MTDSGQINIDSENIKILIYCRTDFKPNLRMLELNRLPTKDISYETLLKKPDLTVSSEQIQVVPLPTYYT